MNGWLFPPIVIIGFGFDPSPSSSTGSAPARWSGLHGAASLQLRSAAHGVSQSHADPMWTEPWTAAVKHQIWPQGLGRGYLLFISIHSHPKKKWNLPNWWIHFLFSFLKMIENGCTINCSIATRSMWEVFRHLNWKGMTTRPLHVTENPMSTSTAYIIWVNHQSTNHMVRCSDAPLPISPWLTSSGFISGFLWGDQGSLKLSGKQNSYPLLRYYDGS